MKFMSPSNDFAFQSAFDVIAPSDQSLPFVFNSPHSGATYPQSFIDASRLDEVSIRRSEDLFVDELFMDMPYRGAVMLRANFPRAYLDVNREPYELDPKMFDGPLPSYANSRSIRVAGGLGTIARLVSESKEIYQHRLPVAEGLARIENLYKPYHRNLRRLLAETHVKFGHAVLVDCHSMPSGNGNPNAGVRPDFVLGDRYGTSCDPELTDVIATLISSKGYQVNRNKPYAGGFITEHYGRPSTGLHALQIEINRGLYADEEGMAKGTHFNSLRKDLTSVFDKVFKMYPMAGTITPLAAE